MARMRVAEYAKRRGVTRVAVHKAIKTGRLSAASISNEGRFVIIDAERADAEWPRPGDAPRRAPEPEPEPAPDPMENLGPPREPDPDLASQKLLAAAMARRAHLDPPRPEPEPFKPGPVAQAKAVLETYRARLAKLEYEKESGKLIDAGEVESRWISVATTVKTKVLGIPAKARQRIPELSPEMYAELEVIVRETLEDLADQPEGAVSNDEHD